MHCLTQVIFFELGHLDTTQIFLFKLPYLDATRVKRTGLRLHCLTQFKPFGEVTLTKLKSRFLSYLIWKVT